MRIERCVSNSLLISRTLLHAPHARSHIKIYEILVNEAEISFFDGGGQRRKKNNLAHAMYGYSCRCSCDLVQCWLRLMKLNYGPENGTSHSRRARAVCDSCPPARQTLDSAADWWQTVAHDTLMPFHHYVTHTLLAHCARATALALQLNSFSTPAIAVAPQH